MHAEPLYCDLETYSTVPIKHGSHAYAEQAEIMLFAYAFGDEAPKVWDATDKTNAFPVDLYEGLIDPERLTVWHNGANFDRVVMKHCGPVNLPVERIHDTMVQALSHGLPGGLGPLCEILKISADEAKDKRGKQLIQLFCKPRPKSSKLRRATRETHPTEWAEFIEYAARDIPAMRAIYKKMPVWNYKGEERELWYLDQRINDRGIKVDLKLARAALETVDRAQKDLAEHTQLLTDGEVQAATQRDKLLKHILAEYGVALPDLQADTLERRINDQNLPAIVRELLLIRQQASTSSTTKYKALINMASSDGVIRGTTQFCGASRTRRWSGRNFQIQNLPSRGLPSGAEIEAGIEAILAGAADIMYSEPMKIVSAAIRGCLVAREGQKMFVSDLSNIEGRAAAWLAGEDWKLDAFRAVDAGQGDDLYRLAYAKAFNIPVTSVDGGKEKGPHRQIGKVMELMLGYEGGVGAFITGAMTYGIDLDAMADAARPSIPDRILKEAERAWGWASKNKRAFGLEQKTYMVCDALKRLWREAHTNINSYWLELEDAMRNSILNPGHVVEARKIKFLTKGAWCRLILPSGGALCYAAPRLDEKNKISYLGVNSYTRKWGRIKTYGGKLFENSCQAVARDVMAYNMPTMEMVGYDILGTVHDEVITEAPDNGLFSAEELSTILATPPSWGLDMPLAAGGFSSYRYRKD